MAYMDDPEDDQISYEDAKCKQPHEDGSNCDPELSGFDLNFVCLYRLRKETEEALNYPRPWLGSGW